MNHRVTQPHMCKYTHTPNLYSEKSQTWTYKKSQRFFVRLPLDLYEDQFQVHWAIRMSGVNISHDGSKDARLSGESYHQSLLFRWLALN